MISLTGQAGACDASLFSHINLENKDTPLCPQSFSIVLSNHSSWDILKSSLKAFFCSGPPHKLIMGNSNLVPLLQFQGRPLGLFCFYRNDCSTAWTTQRHWTEPRAIVVYKNGCGSDTTEGQYSQGQVLHLHKSVVYGVGKTFSSSTPLGLMSGIYHLWQMPYTRPPVDLFLHLAWYLNFHYCWAFYSLRMYCWM